MRAAYGEGRSLSVNNDDDLLEQDDVHYFGSGLTNYYLHIVKLFEKEQVYAYVVELAHVGLQFAATDLTKVGLATEEVYDLVRLLMYYWWGNQRREKRYKENYLTWPLPGI